MIACMISCLVFSLFYSKKAIKRARYRIKLLKNKKDAIVRQLRKDLVELIQGGYEEAALNRVIC